MGTYTTAEGRMIDTTDNYFHVVRAWDKDGNLIGTEMLFLDPPFEAGHEADLIDFAKVSFESDQFLDLPPGTRLILDGPYYLHAPDDNHEFGDRMHIIEADPLDEYERDQEV
jgi:hypothetical protein